MSRPLLPSLLLCAACLVACGEAAPEPEGRARHLLLLTVDTLQAARLGSHGGPNPTSPNLDRLAEEGTRLANAFVPRGLTLPSFASLFTSKYPPEHGMLDNTFSLRESEELLAEHLARAGFRNRAFVANGLLQPLRCNIEQGLELEKHTFDVDEDLLTEQALDYLRRDFGRGARRDFLWVHYFNPHKPYLPAPEYSAPFLDPDYDGEFDGRAPSMKRIFVERIDLAPADLNHILGHYDGAVRYVDDCIGRLLNALEASGVADETLVVFAADHGEELYLHNHYFYHANSVYRSVTQVPLVFRQPGQVTAGRVVDELVSSLDVMPTLLFWMGLAGPLQPENALRGNDLSDCLAGAAPPGREFVHVFHQDDIHVVRSLDWMYVWNPERITPNGPPKEGVYPIAERELYDLRVDPDEQHNVLEEHPDVAQRLQAEIDRFRATLRTVEPYQSTQAELLTPRLRELAELGYIEFEDIETLRAGAEEEH